MSDVVRVTAMFLAKQGEEKNLLSAIQELAVATRKENGCLRYEPHTCVDNPRKLIIIEEWTSMTHLEAHTTQPHVTVFRQNADAFMAAPADIQVWKQA